MQMLAIVHGMAGGLLSRSEGWPPLASLAPISLLAGVAILWVFRRFSDQARIREAKRQLAACLYELRLFGDEPRLVWRAQKRLLTWNLHYLSLLVRPVLVLALPMVLLFVQLDAFYAWSPLAVGEPAIVTVQMNGELDEDYMVPSLEAPAGIVVESPGVRVLGERQISWRVRPIRELSGSFRIVWPDAAFDKTIEAGNDAWRLSSRRVSSLVDSFWRAAEQRLPGGAVDWIEVRYPPRAVSFLGFELHWVVWFLAISTSSALLLKKRFRVTL